MPKLFDLTKVEQIPLGGFYKNANVTLLFKLYKINIVNIIFISNIKMIYYHILYWTLNLKKLS